MKKLLIISQHYPPEIGAASNRILHLVSHLHKHNYSMFVITSKPCYPKPSLYKKVKEPVRQANCKIYRIPILPIPSSAWIIRLINQFLFLMLSCGLALYLCLRYSIKDCLTTSPPFLVNFLGVFLTKVLGVRWMMEVRDLWPDSMPAVGALESNHIIFKTLKAIEHRFYRMANQIVVVTHSSKQALVAHGVLKEKIHVITNGIPDWLQVDDYLLKEKTHANEIFNVIYVGNMGLAQNLELLIEAASELIHFENITFYFVGEGADKQNLIKKTKQFNVKNVHFIDGILDKQELIQWYLKADLGIICLKNSALFKTVIPSKLFEYGALKVPILYIGDGEGSDIVSKYSLGTHVKPDKDSITKMILANYDQWMSGGNTKRFYSKNEEFLNTFSWDCLIVRYIEVLENRV